jgi:hypothetical protein
MHAGFKQAVKKDSGILSKIAFAGARHPFRLDSLNDAMIGLLIVAFWCSKNWQSYRH